MGLFGNNSSSDIPTYSYNEDSRLTDLISQIGSNINKGSSVKTADTVDGTITDPYLEKSNSWYDKVMDPNYSSMTDEQMNQKYKTQSEDLINNTFIPNENRYAARMSSLPGVSGSTYSSRKWNEDVISPENTALANLKQNIWDNNYNATRQDVQQANSLMPTLSGINTNQQQYAKNLAVNQNQYNNTSAVNQEQNQQNQLMNYLNSLIGVNSTANSGSYNEYQSALQKAQIQQQQQQANNGFLGQLLGGGLSLLTAPATGGTSLISKLLGV